MAQTVNFIDEQHVAGVQICKNRRQIPGALNRGAACYADIVTHFGGDDARERRLAQPRRTVKQNVIQRFAPRRCRLHIDAQAFLQLFLTEVIGKRPRAQRLLRVLIFLAKAGRNQAFFFLHGFHSFIAFFL